MITVRYYTKSRESRPKTRVTSDTVEMRAPMAYTDMHDHDCIQMLYLISVNKNTEIVHFTTKKLRDEAEKRIHHNMIAGSRCVDVTDLQGKGEAEEKRQKREEAEQFGSW